MGTTESLAQWIVATSYADIPAAAYEQAKKSLLDFLGTAILPCTGALLRDEVRQGLEGKFCLRYNIAAAVIDGKIDLDTFTDKRADQGDIQALMARIRLTRNPDVALRRPHIADGNPEARLVVKMRDGRAHDMVLPPAMHLTGDAVVDKFRANAAYVFDRARIDRPIGLVQRLEAVADVGELVDAVTVARS
jgi:2-methylcitrate dehydratase PrpD